VAVGLVVGAAAGAADVPKGAEAFQGVWGLAAGEADGKALGEKHLKGGKLEIKGNTYTVTLPEREAVQGTQKLDPTKTPMTIDITDTTGANKGKTCLGIYELKGDEYRVAFAPPGQPRPTKFATAAGSGQWLHVWKKAK